MAKKGLNQEQIMNLLDVTYTKVLDGVPKISTPVNELAYDYLDKYDTVDKAARSMINNQIAKCTTSGFISGFGGIVTLPVALPANITSVIYVQMRMIACAACMAGYDLRSDQVQTFVYACLAGVSVNHLVKQAGIKVGVKVANNVVKKIPGSVLIAINKKVGFRLLTKFGQKGVINFGKMIPVAGAVVGGGFDLVETKIIGDRAYKMFIEGNFDIGE